ncbi:MAG: molybdenum cofactor guanylyltransferase [Polynucleobacter sp.]|nr:MAG: molybdenum cofactor guanylyltransferase [Polynucleobacter sp.]
MSADLSITGLILSGGLSTRMGGVDKGLIGLNDQPMIAHIINKLKRQVGQIFISANHHEDDYASFGYPVVKDFRDYFAGPLAGVEAVVEKIDTPYLGVIPCDTPFFPSDLFSKLKQHMLSNDLKAAYAAVSAEDKNQVHPLCCLMDSSVSIGVKEYLERGGAKAVEWLNEIGATPVLFHNPFEFINLNRPEDWIDLKDSY